MSPRPCLVILTGGALPHQAKAQPDQVAIAVALQEAADAPLLLLEDDPAASRLRHAAAAGWRHGYQRAAADHRVVSIYVVDDPAEAELLAQAISREVDPTYVIRAASPLKEALGCYHQARAAAEALIPEAEIADDTPKEAH